MAETRRSQPRLLQAARQAIRDGRKREARALLQEALRQDPEDYRAWLWLAGVASGPQASLKYIERAEQLAPDEASIARARAWVERQLATEGASPAAQQGAAPKAGRRSRPEREERAPQRAKEAAATAPEEQKRGKRRAWRPLALAVAGLALVTVLLLASGFIWRAGNGNEVQGPETAEVAAAGDVDQRAAIFVSGHFAPKNPAALEERGEDTGEDSAAEATATPPPLGPKAMAASKEGDGPRPTWTMTPTPTPTFTPTPTPVPTFVSSVSNPRPADRPAGVGPNERWIDVNLTAQQLVAYEGDTPVFDTLVSSGTYNHPTVTGQFRIWLRYQKQLMDGRRLGYDYYLPDVPYVMYFYQDYALHGTYWHNNFGTPMSHGCVNLPTPAAEWIFNWSRMGTVVNVHY